MSGLFYALATGTMKVLLRLLSTWRVEGEKVPGGPIIIVSNHLSLIDPPLLAASLPRPIHFMAKEEYFGSFFPRVFIQGYGAFPVRRGAADPKAFRHALHLLAKGLALGMFPEGTRSRQGQLQRGQPGAAFLALKSSVPLVPVAITGSERVQDMGDIFCRPTITVRIGPAFRLPRPGSEGRISLTEVTDYIMERIAELLPGEYRGVYGGRLLVQEAGSPWKS